MAGEDAGHIDPAAFDAVAAEYDEGFTRSRLGQMLRRRVWNEMAIRFEAGDHILELACGTGADALWLADRGIQVTATDGSAEMVDVAAGKVLRAGLDEQVRIKQISLQEIGKGRLHGAGPFDGVLSNFGGLNALGEWRPLAEALAGLLKPKATTILVVMGPYCPWEFGWHMVHGEWRTASRRLGRSARASIGDKEIPVWYPTGGELRRSFSPWFRHVKTESLGLLLPPSHLSHLVDRWPRLFQTLDRMEAAVGRLWRGWGDHYILTLQRVR